MSLKKERRSMSYYEFYKLLEHLRNTYIPVTSFLLICIPRAIGIISKYPDFLSYKEKFLSVSNPGQVGTEIVNRRRHTGTSKECKDTVIMYSDFEAGARDSNPCCGCLSPYCQSSTQNDLGFRCDAVQHTLVDSFNIIFK